MADPLANLGVAALPATPPPSAPSSGGDPLASLGVPAIDLSAGLVPRIDLSAGLVSKTNPASAAPQKEAFVGETGNQGTLANLAIGFSKEANKTAIGVKNLANKVLPSSMQIPALPVESTDLESHGIAQGAGGLAETGAEFFVGDEAAKALSEVGAASKYLKGAASWNEYLKNSPTAARAIDALGRIARATLVGGAQGGVKGAATGDAMGGTESGALQTAIGAGVGEGLGAAARGVASKILPKVATGIEESGNKAANSILRAKTDRSFLYGKNPGNVIADEKIPITNSLSELKQSVEGAMNNLDGMVKAKLSDPTVASKKIDAAKIVNGAVDDSLKELQSRQGITNRKGVVEALNNLRFGNYDADGNLVARIKRADLAPAEVQDLKKNIGKSTKWNTLGADPEIAEFVNNTRKAIYGRLNDAVDEIAPGTKALNMRFANAIEANRLLEQRINREGMNELGMGRLVKKAGVAGAVYALLSGNPIGGLGAGALELANEGAWRTTAGRIMRARAAEGLAEGVRGTAPAIRKIGTAARAGGALTGAALANAGDNGEGSTLAGEAGEP